MINGGSVANLGRFGASSALCGESAGYRSNDHDLDDMKHGERTTGRSQRNEATPRSV
jgi:hypothetical protein